MPVGGFVNNLSPGNFQADGVYIQQSTSPVTPTGPAVGKLGVVGFAQWGLKNTPLAFSNAASGFALFGPNTAISNAIMRDAQAAMPEANQLVGVRITDGTDTAATIVVQDASAGTVFTLTAQQTGSLPNGVNASGVVTNPAQAQCSFSSGTATGGNPVILVAITFPNQPVERYFVTAGGTGGYVAATFKANLLAALNTGTANSAPSPRWTATSGASTLVPLTTAFSASGGTDGATTITSALFIGQDGTVGRTGMYALRGAIQGGQFIFAGFSDMSQSQTIIAFNRTEGTRFAISAPIGTSTTTMQGLKATYSASDPTLDTCIDWGQMIDSWTGQTVYVAPAAGVNGVISSLDFYQDPSNKPYTGKVGIFATERSTTPLSQSEAATRQASGIMYLTNPINRGAVWGLPHGKASDGVSNISDVRTANYIGLSLFTVLGPFVGEVQSQAQNDPTRLAASGAVAAFMNTLLLPIPKISAYSNVMDTSNNTPTTIAQGFLFDNLSVQTLAGVQFILVSEQVGTNVQITVKAA